MMNVILILSLNAGMKICLTICMKAQCLQSLNKAHLVKGQIFNPNEAKSDLKNFCVKLKHVPCICMNFPVFVLYYLLQSLSSITSDCDSSITSDCEIAPRYISYYFRIISISTCNHMFGRAIWDKLPECIFENFEIARVK